MNKGMIFDITRNSFVDGPGIRTTVFFKGCNLNCQWCHNPESRSPKKQMLFYKNKCTDCQKCKEVCPYELKQCDFCGKCVLYCPNDARKISGEEMSAEEVFAEIIKDKDFYEASGGGVTFSGGECMLQADFLLELLKVCKQNKIHTAIDTAGHIEWKNFEKVMPYTDLFLYDIKIFDSKKHKEYVGTENSLILENLKKLAGAGKEIAVRVPIIGGVNDIEKEIENIANFLKSVNISNVELLPYHKMGEHKFDALDLPLKSFLVPENEKMQKFKNIFKN